MLGFVNVWKSSIMRMLLLLMMMTMMMAMMMTMMMTVTLMMQDMWEDVKMRVPALAPSNLGGVCNIMKVQVILKMICFGVNFSTPLASV